MAIITVNKVVFDFDLGAKLLKAKYKDVPFNGLEDIWNDIQPITVNDILTKLENIEQRRVALGIIGIEEVTKQLKSVLVDSETIRKTTTWVKPDGEMETFTFDDTYELFKIKSQDWTNTQFRGEDVYYIRFKDTSTDRTYMLWIDINSVGRTNKISPWSNQLPRAIDCIAWSFTTNLELGSIKSIIRQGDCILYKPKRNAKYLETPRHLTRNEYLELMEAES